MGCRCKIIMLGMLLGSVLPTVAQQDSISRKAFSAIAGIHATQAILDAPALAGQVKLRYGVVDITGYYGKNKANLRNINGFDEVRLEGDWYEVSAGLIIPYNDPQSTRLNGLRIGMGLGVARTLIENTEIFEALPPFEDLKYRKTYTNDNQRYLSFSFGYQHYLHHHIELSLGVVAFHKLRRVYVPNEADFLPFLARSPVGLYVELGFVL